MNLLYVLIGALLIACNLNFSKCTEPASIITNTHLRDINYAILEYNIESLRIQNTLGAKCIARANLAPKYIITNKLMVIDANLEILSKVQAIDYEILNTKYNALLGTDYSTGEQFTLESLANETCKLSQMGALHTNASNETLKLYKTRLASIEYTIREETNQLIYYSAQTDTLIKEFGLNTELRTTILASDLRYLYNTNCRIITPLMHFLGDPNNQSFSDIANHLYICLLMLLQVHTLNSTFLLEVKSGARYGQSVRLYDFFNDFYQNLPSLVTNDNCNRIDALNITSAMNRFRCDSSMNINTGYIESCKLTDFVDGLILHFMLYEPQSCTKSELMDMIYRYILSVENLVFRVIAQDFMGILTSDDNPENISTRRDAIISVLKSKDSNTLLKDVNAYNTLRLNLIME